MLGLYPEQKKVMFDMFLILNERESMAEAYRLRKHLEKMRVKPAIEFLEGNMAGVMRFAYALDGKSEDEILEIIEKNSELVKSQTISDFIEEHDLYEEDSEKDKEKRKKTEREKWMNLAKDKQDRKDILEKEALVEGEDFVYVDKEEKNDAKV